jgi:hypothetical protein
MHRAASFCATIMAVLAASYLPGWEASAQQPASDRNADIVASIPSPRHDRAENCLEQEIHSLSAESDFTVFLQQDCAPDVKLKALRHLWRLLPQAPIAFDSAM